MTYRCRACGSTRLRSVVDLGETPLANALLDESALLRAEARFPLEVVFCEDCTLVQITTTVSPKQLFSQYVYFSSFSDAAVDNAKEIADRLVRALELTPASLVIEAASNDGYLLKHYQARGIPVLGVEPAENIAAHANKRGIPTRCAFFGREEAQRLADDGLRADVFHANNVLAHVADLNGFLAGLAIILKPNGTASIEVPYVRDLVEQMEFDTIYHEHLCYFSLTAISRALERHDLVVVDVEHIPIHGGTLRYFIRHRGQPVAASVSDMLADEERLGLTAFAYYADFASRIAKLKHDLTGTLRKLKAAGSSIAAYGASAKGATLMNTFEIGHGEIDFVVDRSTVKQGKYTPGTHLKILPPEALLERQPDYLLLLTWNFADEILAQQAEYRARGGKVIFPVPHVRIV
jgi:SAM-dependent methyltransferase